MAESDSNPIYDEVARNQRPVVQIPIWKHCRDNQHEKRIYGQSNEQYGSQYIPQNSTSCTHMGKHIW